jgi:anti-anti-sigma factor
MAVHALTEVTVAPGRARQALWAAARLGRLLLQQPGFRGLRVFRSEVDADLLMVLTEWAEWDAAVAAEMAAPVALLLQQVRGACARWDDRRLQPLFHVQFPRRAASAGMAQALSLDSSEAPVRHKEFGLKAMTLPGTIGVLGGRCDRDPSFYFCAIEFESDEAMIDFAGSRTQHDWARLGASTWWHKEPRLEVSADRLPEQKAETERRAETLGSLNVRIERSPDGSRVTLRLHGRMDQAAAERFVQVRDAVVAGGCRELTLDVSDLSYASREGLDTLLVTARQVKEAGGRFTLADNQGRFNRILRVLQLNQVLSLGRGQAPPRRRAANLRFRPPGTA